MTESKKTKKQPDNTNKYYPVGNPCISRSQLDPLYREALFAFIPHVLKTFSSKENPLTVPEIMEYLTMFTGQVYNRNTFDRYFSDMITLMTVDSDSYQTNDMKNALIYTYGGSIHEIENEKSSRNYGNLYYFEPYLSESDVNMLCASVTSNRYLNEAEKKYLNLRLKTLSPYPASMDLLEKKGLSKREIISTNARKIIEQQNNDINNIYKKNCKISKQKPLLNIIQTLNDAICNKLQIKIKYGIYDYDNTQMRLDHISLTERGSLYRLNPYALCWNNGSYYLICTKNGTDRIYHLRVDRIIDAAKIETVCEKMPPRIKPFFNRTGFDVEKYTRTHPYMGIYNETDRVNAVFEISSKALSILVDYFGMDIRLTVVDDDRSIKDETDGHTLRAEINDVEYSCLFLFTTQHHHVLKVLSPERLITDLKESLSKSLEKYE